MLGRTARIVLMGLAVCSCGGGDGGGGADREAAAPGGSEAAAPDASSGGSAGYTRASFVLCSALEAHRAELAAIVGFEQDVERALGNGSECIVHGEDVGFARVQLAPTVMRSIDMYAGGFEAEKSPAPQLGPDALFVDGRLQPHVVFSMGPLILDVDAENLDTPSRETMIELALRVREILTEANAS